MSVHQKALDAASDAFDHALDVPGANPMGAAIKAFLESVEPTWSMLDAGAMNWQGEPPQNVVRCFAAENWRAMCRTLSIEIGGVTP